jgi:hypothetical protein
VGDFEGDLERELKEDATEAVGEGGGGQRAICTQSFRSRVRKEKRERHTSSLQSRSSASSERAPSSSSEVSATSAALRFDEAYN